MMRLLCLLIGSLLVVGCGDNGGGGSGGTAGAGGTGGTDAAGGSGGTGGTGGMIDAGPDGPPPNCTLVGNEVQLTDTPGGISDFAMLWNSDHYVIAFPDNTTAGGDIYILTMAADGTPMGSATLLEATTPTSNQPTLAKTDNGVVVAWQEGASPQTVRVHGLDSADHPAGSGNDVAVAQTDATRPVIACAPGGGGSVVAWIDNIGGLSAVNVARLDASLQVVSSVGVKRLGATTADVNFPWLAGDGTHLSAIWSDKRTGVYDIRYAQLDGQLVVSNENVVRDAANDALLGRLILTGFGAMAAWEDYRSGTDNEIYSALVGTDGQLRHEILVEEPGTGDANWPHLAWNGSATGVVYYQFRNGAPQIFISFVDPDGNRVGGGSDLQVSHSTGRARFPNVQWDGTYFGVSWLDTRGATPQAWFARVSCQ